MQAATRCGLRSAIGIGLPLDVVIPNDAVTFSVLGFVGGTIFSTVLTLAEGRRSFDQLPVPDSWRWERSEESFQAGSAASTRRAKVE